MIYWATRVNAFDPQDGKMKTWPGPQVPGDTKKDAQEYCNCNNLGYLKIIGKVVGVVSQEEDPDAHSELYIVLAN